MKDRIRLIRMEADLTQTEFGSKIDLTRGAVQKIEHGDNNPSKNTIRAICDIFHVRREWLESGQGPMRQPEAEDDELIDEILKDDDGFVRAVIKGIARTPGGWEKMREIFTAISEEL